ncbi:MAG TPA: aspartate-semialdehyde dehydrogenase [Deltaproteobacteria bacterium]|nr:MAG: aspartate-semialdehyde dehydrogenase [Deltaproteobacteria bacterium GWA2_45_12]HBF12946.1 aspartate-semialdehyde dehydrogenase [Deltaproteobacteria bacterium]
MQKKSKYNIAIAGATGAVGEEFLRVLAKRNFPIGELRLLASKKSVGKKMKFCGKEYPVSLLTHDSFKNIDIALFSAGGARSLEFAPSAVKAGAVVVDNSSVYRMDPNVPLVVPEVNPEDIAKHKGIIANPNCTTIIAAMAIWPIHCLAPIKRMTIATYQAVSGAGAKAIDELESQTRAYLEGKPVARGAIFKHPIAFNLFSHDSAVGEEGYSQEEMKVVHETRKIFHDKEILVSPTCVRVPIFRAHAEAIHLELGKPVSVEKVRQALAKMPGVKVVDSPKENYFPMPVDVSGKDEVYVGRIRKDLWIENGINLFVCGDQILKGAALNAVQIAEKLIS